MPKKCATCRHVKRCDLFKEMVKIETIWNSEHIEELKFPFEPVNLANTCPDYESPQDVVVLANQESLT